MSIPVVTIDGPSGAGKGTVSRAVAMQLGWGYLDSGAIYRSLATATAQQGVDVKNVAAVVKAAQDMLLEFECAAELIVKLDGINITSELAAETTGNTASIIAAYPEVRAVLLQKQRDFRKAPGLVADGRDMGTVVFADAEKKVYLTASAEERGKRRYKQLKEKGINANLLQITEEIESRDRRDRERVAAPLKMAEDALHIDSSQLSIEQVIKEVLDWVR